jgi:hypothetical protein
MKGKVGRKWKGPMLSNVPSKFSVNLRVSSGILLLRLFLKFICISLKHLNQSGVKIYEER